MRPHHLALAVLVPLIWGMGFVFAKAAIEHFSPILLMAFRFAVTALALVWFVRPPLGKLRAIFFIALVSAAIQYSLTFTGLVYVDASTAILIIQLEVPFLVLIGAVALGEQPSLRKWIGIAIAFAGVALIAGDPSLDAAWWALGLIVCGAFVWAAGQAMVRRLGRADGFTLIAWVAVFASPQLFVMSLLFEQDQLAQIQSANWIVWGTVIYLGLVMTALGYGVWYSLIGAYPIGQVGPFLLLLPVFSVAGGVLLLGEELTVRIAVGGAIVVAGLAVITVERPRKPQAPSVAGSGTD